MRWGAGASLLGLLLQPLGRAASESAIRSPRELAGALGQALLTNAACPQDDSPGWQRVAPGLYGVVGPDPVEQGGYVYPHVSAFTWLTDWSGLELALNSYCCGLPKNATLDERRAACLCSLAAQVSFPVTASGSPSLGLIITRGPGFSAPTGGGSGSGTGDTFAVSALDPDSIVDVLMPVALRFAFEDAPCNMTNATVNGMFKRSLQDPVGYCAWAAGLYKGTNRTVAEALDIPLCNAASFASNALGGSGLLFGQAGAGLGLSARDICDDMDAMMYFWYGPVGQASALFNTPDTTKTACGVTQVVSLANLQWARLQDEAGGAAIYLELVGRENAFWSSPRNSACTLHWCLPHGALPGIDGGDRLPAHLGTVLLGHCPLAVAMYAAGVCVAEVYRDRRFAAGSANGTCTCPSGSPGQLGAYPPHGQAGYDPCVERNSTGAVRSWTPIFV